jgi:hypothetical protein
VNVTGLVQLHEGKRHHESDSGPLETPDDRFKHPDDTLARELQPSTSRALASEHFANAATGLQNFYARKHKPTVSADRRRSVDRTVYLPSAFGPLSSAFCLLFYGVGDGDSAAAGDSVADGEASVFGSFFLAARFLCGVAEGEACAVAAVAVVDVAVVPDFSAQETTNAMPIKAVIKDKTVFFIVCG